MEEQKNEGIDFMGIGMSGGIAVAAGLFTFLVITGNSPSVGDDHSHDGLWRMV